MNRKKFFSIYFFTLFVFLYGCIEKQNPKSTSTKSQSLQSSSPPKTRPNAKPTPGYVIALQEKKRLQQDKKAHVRRYHALRKKRHKQQKQRREQIQAQLKQRANTLGARLKAYQAQQASK